MGGYPAGGEDDAFKLVAFEHAQIGGREILGDQYGVVGNIVLVAQGAGKIFQKPLRGVFDVGGPFAQIGIVDFANRLHIAFEDHPDGIFRD